MIIKVTPKKLDKTVTANEIRSFVGDYDKAVIDYISCANAFGNRVRITDGACSSVKETILAFNAKGTKIKIKEPYLLPAFACVSCYAFSKTEITVLDEKGIISKAVELVVSLGVDCNVNGDILIVNGKGGIKGGIKVNFSDYYSVMAVMLAGTETEEPIEIETDCKEINGFIELFNYLGGDCKVVE